MNRLAVYAVFLVMMVAAPLTPADEFRPALLEINEGAEGLFRVSWKVPLKNGRRLEITPKFSADMERIGPEAVRIFQGSAIAESSWRIQSGKFVGSNIEIEGLRGFPIDVIVQIDLADGSEHSTILRPAYPSWTVPERATRWMVAGSYWKIGTIHILEGFDHLLFVLALMLIVPNLWMLVKTITAFTVSHSISLGLATLGVLNMPGAPTEAVISLSILFLAVEIIHSREGRVTLTEQYPWIVAFVFGLVHGLGFAGALAEVGLPQQEIPLSLLMFNVGVETGQLLFVGAVLLILEIGKRIPFPRIPESWRLIPYSIGSVAAFWTIDRVDQWL